jgi:hypothetical protein
MQGTGQTPFEQNLFKKNDMAKLSQSRLALAGLRLVLFFNSPTTHPDQKSSNTAVNSPT